VAKVLDNGEEEIIWSGNSGELIHLGDAEDDDTEAARVRWNCEDPSVKMEGEEFVPVPGIGYIYTHKGGWGTAVELPDDEEFDVKKLCFDVNEIEGLAEVVTGFSYNGEDYQDDSDSDGKSCDMWLNVDGGYEVRLL